MSQPKPTPPSKSEKKKVPPRGPAQLPRWKVSFFDGKSKPRLLKISLYPSLSVLAQDLDYPTQTISKLFRGHIKYHEFKTKELKNLVIEKLDPVNFFVGV